MNDQPLPKPKQPASKSPANQQPSAQNQALAQQKAPSKPVSPPANQPSNTQRPASQPNQNPKPPQQPPQAPPKPPTSGAPSPSSPTAPTTASTSNTTNNRPPAAPPNRPPIPNASQPPQSPPKSNSSEDTNPKKQPTFAKASSLPFPRWVLFVIGGLVLLGIIGAAAYFLLAGGQSSSPVPTTSNTGTNNSGTTGSNRQQVADVTTLTYWGLWEPSDVLEEVFADFEAANPGIQVNYVKQSYRDYRERLQTAIASRSGPDVFKFHASWVPMLEEELDSMPTSVMTASEYRQSFFPIASQQLQSDGQIVGVPLMYDSIGLYYNTTIFTDAGVQPPSTWAELKTLAQQLTVANNNEIERGGLAIGNATNVEHFGDILGLLILQNGGDPTDPTSQEVQEALKFYTNFISVDNVWSADLPNATVAFARGEAAMMIAPSWRAHEVSNTNPDLEFEVVPVPRLGEERLTWATYWADGVNSKGSNRQEAWQLLDYLSSPEVMQQLYANQSEIRRFGQIYSRVDLAETLLNDPVIGGFIEDANMATNWYLNTYTHDGGINDQLLEYYTDAINALLDGDDAADVTETLEQGTQQVLRQYGVSSTAN